MFKHLIVGVDGREGGSDAVALARALAAPDARIVLAHAYPFDAHSMVRGPEEERLRAAALDMLSAEGDDERYESRVLPDLSPARALHELAEQEGAELIVVGSCHRSPAGKLLLGDVARATLHGAHCPVAMAPRGHREQAKPLRSVAVGVDDGAAAHAAFDVAVRIATDASATLRVLSVVHVPVAFAPAYAYAYDWPQLQADQTAAATRTLAELTASIDVPVVTDVVTGIPSEELEKLSRGVDLLVLGSRGWGAVTRVVLGSTANRVVHAAACPVVVVPAPAETRSADVEDAAQRHHQHA
jgi:nucleotide-binding universal stress UspA family protein